MHAAGIISDHAAERAMIVRRRIGPEREMIFFRFRAQIVQNNSRLDARKFFWTDSVQEFCASILKNPKRRRRCNIVRHKLVPPPRDKTGAENSRQTEIV